MAAAVLSGNRNFEGRIHANVRANYLASPPLVVAYALAGSMNVDLYNDPLGNDTQGQPVYLKDIWPSPQEVNETMRKSVRSEMFKKEYSQATEGDEQWQNMPVPEGELFKWDMQSTYVREAPYFDDMKKTPGEPREIKGARVLALLGDSVTTDHISPAGAIERNGPAARYLTNNDVLPKDYNQYGARRGNHEVMMRGTFANIRLKNALAPGTEGGVTVHLPDKKPMSIYDAAMQYQKEGVAADRGGGQRIWHRLVAGLGGQRAAAARHQSGHRRKLRAYSPEQLDRHGHRAAAIQTRRESEKPWAHRLRDFRRRRHLRRTEVAAGADRQSHQRRRQSSRNSQ